MPVLHNWLVPEVRNMCRLPEGDVGGNAPGEPDCVYKRGLLNGKKAEFFKLGGTYAVFVYGFEGDRGLLLRHQDPGLLERYINATEGAVEFEP